MLGWVQLSQAPCLLLLLLVTAQSRVSSWQLPGGLGRGKNCSKKLGCKYPGNGGWWQGSVTSPRPTLGPPPARESSENTNLIYLLDKLASSLIMAAANDSFPPLPRAACQSTSLGCCQFYLMMSTHICLVCNEMEECFPAQFIFCFPWHCVSWAWEQMCALCHCCSMPHWGPLCIVTVIVMLCI